MLVYAFIHLFIGHLCTQQIILELLSDSGHMEAYKTWSLPSRGSQTRGREIKEASAIIQSRSHEIREKRME